MDINNAVVLITGANGGIGRGFVEEFFLAGAQKIYLGVRNTADIKDFIKVDSNKLVPLQLDVTNEDHIKNAAQKAKDVTILVNNAGVLHRGHLTDKARITEARDEMEVNYFGPLALIHKFAPILRANGGGAIVNVSSIAGLIAMPNMPTYSTSKAAVHFLTLEARMELAEQNTRVIGVYPGPVDTAMAQSSNIVKVEPNQVAKSTIQGILSGENYIFPDPVLKDIYAVLQKTVQHPIQKIQNFVQPQQAQAA